MKIRTTAKTKSVELRTFAIAVLAAGLSWSAAAQQPVTGHGTPNTIPVWVSSSILGNSMMSQSSGKVDVSGGVSATGTVTASGFSGNGSGLNNVNAATLSGLGSGAFAQLAAQNTFTTTQTIDGNLNVAGSFNDALTLQGNLTDSGGDVSANVIGGFGGNNSFPGNSVAPGVVAATIAGGGGTLAGSAVPNTVTVYGGTVSGGIGNTAGGRFDTVSGGVSNTANGYLGSVVAGGQGNTSSGLNSTVSGGFGNIASAPESTVPGGENNIAGGQWSFAAGQASTANSQGSFVWNDGSYQSLTDFGPNTFSARASGGFAFYTGTSSGAYLPAGSGSWASLSDRNAKANFSMVDGQALLSHLAELPIATWNYTSQADSIRHMGPTAQDFRAAFGLGEDERHISTVDSEGVALAAVQALYKLSQQQVQELTHQVNELETKVALLSATR